MRVVVRGGGDLASGTVYKLFQCGFEVVILECENLLLFVVMYLLVRQCIMEVVKLKE